MYDDAKKLIELAPNYRMGYEYRGRAYLEVGQQQAAIADFSKAISIDPDASYGYSMRGRAYYFLNQFNSAMGDFQAALRIAPKATHPFSHLPDFLRTHRRPSSP